MLSVDMIKEIKRHDEDGIFDKFKEKILRNEDSEYLESLPDLKICCYDEIIALMRIYLEFDFDIETFRLLASVTEYEVDIFKVASVINQYKIPFDIVKLCTTDVHNTFFCSLFELYNKGFKEKQINYLKISKGLKEYNPIKIDLLNCILDYPYIDIDEDELCLLQKFCSSNWKLYVGGYHYFHEAINRYRLKFRRDYYTKEFIKTILSAFINGHTPAELEKYVLIDSEIDSYYVDNLKKTIEALDEYRELSKLCAKSALKNYDLSSI